MLLDRASTTQSFSESDASEDMSSPPPAERFRTASGQAGDLNRQPCEVVDKREAMEPGDEVVFARLDVAEALGIWRHATGRVIETHDEGQPSPEGTVSVDVQFEGHETLYRYLPDLFEKRMN